MKKISLMIFAAFIIIMGILLFAQIAQKKEVKNGLYVFYDDTNRGLLINEGIIVKKIGNSFKPEEIFDKKAYSEFYYDSYHKQKIFYSNLNLNYQIGDTEFTTRTETISGYVVDVRSNEKYQIGVEILDESSDATVQSNEFDGARTRIIDLKTRESVTLDGFSQTCELVGDYAYCRNYQKTEKYLEVIDLKEMKVVNKHILPNDDGNFFTFKSKTGVFVHIISTNKTFFMNEKIIEEYRTDVFDKIPTDTYILSIESKELSTENNVDYNYFFSYKDEFEDVYHFAIHVIGDEVKVIYGYADEGEGTSGTEGVAIPYCGQAEYLKDKQSYIVVCVGKKNKKIGTYIKEYDKNGKRTGFKKISDGDTGVLNGMSLISA